MLLGVASVVFAAGFRAFPVLVEKQEMPPPPPPPPPGMEDMDPWGPGSVAPAGPITVLVPEETPEPEVVREVTVGGLERMASGELKRTYSGAPPSACPT
jgi:hypothetical protein